VCQGILGDIGRSKEKDNSDSSDPGIADMNEY